MTFFPPASRVISCFGASSAVLSAASDMPAFAMTKFRFAERIPASTFLRTSIFSRTRSRYWRISSSRLSFRSLWPRIAVIRFFFRRVSSILVGFTCFAATMPPPYYRLRLPGQAPSLTLRGITAFRSAIVRFRFAPSHCGRPPYAPVQKASCAGKPAYRFLSMCAPRNC